MATSPAALPDRAGSCPNTGQSAFVPRGSSTDAVGEFDDVAAVAEDDAVRELTHAALARPTTAKNAVTLKRSHNLLNI
jgi:hypothetical protein